MALIVQKFGGDALGEKGKGKAVDHSDLTGPTLVADKFRHVAEIIARSVHAGHKVVAIGSAMGDTTNRLLRMANALSAEPPARELDMLMTTGEQQSIALLAIALHEAGIRAVSFTGPQVGIVTDQLFGKSRIREIRCEKLKAALSEGLVPIVAGFQGVSEENELTTLGRGGSDISAVAIAAAIRADVCEFYKDVDGVFTTDPRVCFTARKIDRISYDEMLELASGGAGVLHSRSIEFAKKYRIPLHVRSFLHDGEGTYITAEEKRMENVVVSGLAFNKDEAKISVIDVPDRPGVAAELFSRLGEAGIIVDVIIQSVGYDGHNDISFTVHKNDFKQAMKLVETVAQEIGAARVESDDKVCKLSIVGVGMRSHSNVAGKMFRALAQAGINIQMISTSEIKISVVLAQNELDKAINAVHKVFEDQTEFQTVEERM